MVILCPVSAIFLYVQNYSKVTKFNLKIMPDINKEMPGGLKSKEKDR